jgi:hypothetical protein
MAQMIHEHHTHVRTPEGAAYVPRTYADRQADGTWEAWLEFHPLNAGAPALRTERETSQATREAVANWALGLEPAYFQGAFERARLIASQ